MGKLWRWTGGVALALTCALGARTQQTPDAFRWVDFHAAADQDTVVWVTRSLAGEKWTAIREIGVAFDAALVVTTLRATPQSPTNADTFTVWSASLTNHTVTPLVKGVNLRLRDWLLLAPGSPRELAATYEDCRECSATTYFTAFYYDVRVHGWNARWMRGEQAVPLESMRDPEGVQVTHVYAVLAEPNGHQMLATWSHFDYGAQKDAEDFLYQYDVDPYSRVDRMQLVSGKAMEPLEKRLCAVTDAMAGVARGQDSALCKPPAAPPQGRRRGQR